MSVQHIAAILDCRDPRLAACRKFVLVALANRTDEDGRCWPSQSRLAAECGITTRALSAHLKSLEDDGFITRDTVHKGQGMGSRTTYTLHLSALKGAPENFAPANFAPEKNVVCTGSLLPVTNPQEPSISQSMASAPEPERKNGSRLPASWELTEPWREEARQAAFKAKQPISEDEISNEADKFRDYWCGQPGSKGRKLDWLGTWRNWIRRAAPEIVRARSRAGNTTGQRTGNGYGKPQSRFAPAISQHDAFALAAAQASDPERSGRWEPDHGYDPRPPVGSPRLEVIDSGDARDAGAGNAGGDRGNDRQIVLPLPITASR